MHILEPIRAVTDVVLDDAGAILVYPLSLRQQAH